MSCDVVDAYVAYVLIRFVGCIRPANPSTMDLLGGRTLAPGTVPKYPSTKVYIYIKRCLSSLQRVVKQEFESQFSKLVSAQHDSVSCTILDASRVVISDRT